MKSMSCHTLYLLHTTYLMNTNDVTWNDKNQIAFPLQQKSIQHILKILSVNQLSIYHEK